MTCNLYCLINDYRFLFGTEPKNGKWKIDHSVRVVLTKKDVTSVSHVQKVCPDKIISK